MNEQWMNVNLSSLSPLDLCSWEGWCDWTRRPCTVIHIHIFNYILPSRALFLATHTTICYGQFAPANDCFSPIQTITQTNLVKSQQLLRKICFKKFKKPLKKKMASDVNKIESDHTRGWRKAQKDKQIQPKEGKIVAEDKLFQVRKCDTFCTKVQHWHRSQNATSRNSICFSMRFFWRPKAHTRTKGHSKWEKGKTRKTHKLLHSASWFLAFYVTPSSVSHSSALLPSFRILLNCVFFWHHALPLVYCRRELNGRERSATSKINAHLTSPSMVRINWSIDLQIGCSRSSPPYISPPSHSLFPLFPLVSHVNSRAILPLPHFHFFGQREIVCC